MNRVVKKLLPPRVNSNTTSRREVASNLPASVSATFTQTTDFAKSKRIAKNL